MSPEIPRALTLKLPDRWAAMLAQALLGEGILQEQDWTGSVGPSLAAGIERWGGLLLEGQELRRIELGLFWTDNVGRPAPGMDTRLWRQAAPGRDGDAPIGLLALVREPTATDRYPEERDVYVGRKVLELEAARPGVGYQVLHMLQEVLPPLVNPAVPFYGYSQVMKYAWLLQAAGSPERLAMAGISLPTHHVTPEEYLAVVPREACDWSACPLRPGLLREALRHPLPEHLRPLVARAWELEQLRKVPRDTFRCDSHLLLASETQVYFMDAPGGAAKEISFAIRWSPEDALPRIVDDYHHQIRVRDSETNLLWCQAFPMDDPRAIRKAARNWKTAATLALKACTLAELLHTDEETTE